MKAIRITETGGPEVLETVDVPTPEPGMGEARVRHHAVGLNFIDVYGRSGLYPVRLPAVLGQEAAGEVEALGDGVSELKLGDRVAYTGQLGAYAEAAVVPADRLVRLLDAISYETAAAALLKGLTAEFLARRLRPIPAGESVLVHAAAGGVGSILTQWLAHLGVRVIAAVGSREKADRARALGAEKAFVLGEGDLAARVREATGGRGVSVVFDGVGRATFDASLDSLARRGLLASFGNASGAVPAVEPLVLSRKGSLFLTRPTLADYIADRQELQAAASALWEVVASGAVRIDVGQRFALADVRAAHEALEGRRTTGSTVLIP
ncbi:MAG: quinone oxidoreductase [Caulobacteraceae bacterium]|nr:quinone oxidoreductase [Caulobacter sp.]